MSPARPGRTHPALPLSTACDTTTVFDTSGISDGVNLVHRTRYRLLATGDASFEPTRWFLGRVDRAFRAAYIGAAEVPLVPAPLDAALEDAAALTAEAYADQPDADLRGDVLPAYYGTLVEFFCQNLETAPDAEVGVWLEDESC